MLSSFHIVQLLRNVLVFRATARADTGFTQWILVFWNFIGLKQWVMYSSWYI